MTELELKYGLNPNQKPSRIFMTSGEKLPVEVLNGRPGFINFMDALNSWQLVRELKQATGLEAAASFKHVSPAGAAVASAMTDDERSACFADGLELSPTALAYARARGSDRLCSYGDWAALSDTCDEQTALFLAREVSDGIIAPGFTQKALEILREKRRGGYNVVKIDADYEPETLERREIFGVSFEQGRNVELPSEAELTPNIVTANKSLTESAKRDLLVALITVKYTQSNSVCYVENGQAVGVGAGQQSRVHCVRLAGDKADNWYLRRHPKVLRLPFLPEIPRPARDNAIDAYISGGEYRWQSFFAARPEAFSDAEKREWLCGMSGLALASDAFFPFDDNIERASKSGVKYIAQPGGSIRDDLVIAACDRYGMVMAFTGKRLFHH